MPSSILRDKMKQPEQLLRFYGNAKEAIIKEGYAKEIEYVQKLQPFPCYVDLFLHQYIFVVLSAGMKNQVVEKIMQKMVASGKYDPSVIGHPGKRAAIELAFKEHRQWYGQLSRSPDKLAYLETLPWIGPITKYHLARNIGIDVAKPDRHLVRIAERFGYGSGHSDVQRMCGFISKQTGEKIGVVDVILWRYSNLFGSKGEIDA